MSKNVVVTDGNGKTFLFEDDNTPEEEDDAVQDVEAHTLTIPRVIAILMWEGILKQVSPLHKIPPQVNYSNSHYQLAFSSIIEEEE